MWRWLALLPAFLCVACSGGSGLNPVKGKLTYKDQPLKGALVTFHPKGVNDIMVVRPVGFTQEDGTFTVTTGKDEGAPVGEYVLTFICSEEVGPKGDKKVFSTAQPQTQDRFRGAYSNRDTSTFKVEIKNGPNQLAPFHLK